MDMSSSLKIWLAIYSGTARCASSESENVVSPGVSSSMSSGSASYQITSVPV